MTVNVMTTDSKIKVHFGDKPRLTLKQGNFSFESSKIYALAGDQNNGASALSCLLSGFADIGKNRVSVDGKLLNRAELMKISCFIGLGRQRFFGKYLTVRQQITEALNKSGNSHSFDEIVSKFGLTPERLDRRLAYTGNEHWRASIAIAYAGGKRIYCAPFIDELMWDHYLQLHLEQWIRMLRGEDRVVFLPVSGISKFQDLVDEVIYFQ